MSITFVFFRVASAFIFSWTLYGLFIPESVFGLSRREKKIYRRQLEASSITTANRGKNTSATTAGGMFLFRQEGSHLFRCC